MAKALSVIIVGLGKSGTTALFYKLKSALPHGMVCLFEPRQFESARVGDAPYILAKVLLGANADSFSHFDKKILIVRDPRDRIVSRTLYRVFNFPDFCADHAKVETYMRMLREKESNPENVSMLDLIRLSDRLTGADLMSTIGSQERALIKFHREHSEYFIYRYEDLVANRFEELSSYLSLSLTSEPPEVEAEVSRVTRTKNCGDWRNWFVSDDVTYFRPLLLPLMHHFDYDDNWALASKPSISSEHGSEYVARVVNDRLATEERRRQQETQQSQGQSKSKRSQRMGNTWLERLVRVGVGRLTTRC
jgi:hypothetical protein